jgi:hypothetical protein
LLEPPAPKKPDGFIRKVTSKIDKIMDIKDTTRTIYKSGWAEGGNLVYSIDKNRGTVSLWSVK